MSLTFNTKTYAADQYGPTAVTFIGPAKTVSLKDDLRLARTPPKPTVSYSGNGRTEAKMSRTHTLTGALTPTGDSIFSVGVQLPVGISDANVDTLCDDMAALIGSADFKTHLKKQKIAF